MPAPAYSRPSPASSPAPRPARTRRQPGDPHAEQHPSAPLRQLPRRRCHHAPDSPAAGARSATCLGPRARRQSRSCATGQLGSAPARTPHRPRRPGQPAHPAAAGHHLTCQRRARASAPLPAERARSMRGHRSIPVTRTLAAAAQPGCCAPGGSSARPSGCTGRGRAPAHPRTGSSSAHRLRAPTSPRMDQAAARLTP